MVMPSFDEFVSKLQAVARLLSTPWMRKRLLHTCGAKLQPFEIDALMSFQCLVLGLCNNHTRDELPMFSAWVLQQLEL